MQLPQRGKSRLALRTVRKKESESSHTGKEEHNQYFFVLLLLALEVAWGNGDFAKKKNE